MFEFSKKYQKYSSFFSYVVFTSEKDDVKKSFENSFKNKLKELIRRFEYMKHFSKSFAGIICFVNIVSILQRESIKIYEQSERKTIFIEFVDDVNV